MKFRKLLFDADGTLWDFNASARISIEEGFKRRGLVYSDYVFERYDVINNGLWERYERGEIARDRVLVERFEILFDELGIQEDAAAFENEFRKGLEEHPIWMDGAEELLLKLRPAYEIYIVTNGVASTQRRRIALTGLDRYVDDIFISEEVGAQKPQQAYFDHVLAHIGPCDKNEVLLIGDSLSADILGANRAGIPACWFNPGSQPLRGDAKPDFEIRVLSELCGVLA